jgi:hypothetical protein
MKQIILFTLFLSFVSLSNAQKFEEKIQKIAESTTNGKVEIAIDIVKNMHQAYPDSSKAIFKKIVTISIDEFQKRNRASAIELLEKSKPLYEGEVVLYDVLRQLYWHEFDREKCIENCQMTLKLDSTRIDAQRFLDILQFVPESFKVPDSLVTQNLFVRPLRVSDAELDYKAVMSSINHIRGVFGPDDEWPQETLTLQDDINALTNHEREHERRIAYTYTVMNHSQDKCLGCIYILPIHSKQYDAQVFFWVTKDAYDLGYENELYAEIQNWLKSSWSFKNVIFPGRNMDWGKYQSIQY